MRRGSSKTRAGSYHPSPESQGFSVLGVRQTPALFISLDTTVSVQAHPLVEALTVAVPSVLSDTDAHRFIDLVMCLSGYLDLARMQALYLQPSTEKMFVLRDLDRARVSKDELLAFMVQIQLLPPL